MSFKKLARCTVCCTQHILVKTDVGCYIQSTPYGNHLCHCIFILILNWLFAGQKLSEPGAKYSMLTLILQFSSCSCTTYWHVWCKIPQAQWQVLKRESIATNLCHLELGTPVFQQEEMRLYFYTFNLMICTCININLSQNKPYLLSLILSKCSKVCFLLVWADQEYK